MTAVRAPTLVIGVGAMGRRVAALLARDASALGDPPVRFVVTDRAADAQAEISQAVAALMRIKHGQAKSRLDLVIVADISPGGVIGEVGAVARSLSDLIADSYGVAFPPSAAPEQRGACLVALLATPPLTLTESTRQAITGVSRLEDWSQTSARAPLLSRIYLVPEQNEFGTMGPEDLERALYLFAAATWLSGLRDDPSIARRIEHARDSSRLVSAFNAAAADVSVPDVVDYCMWRTAHVVLQELATRCELPPRTADHVYRAEAALESGEWLQPLEEGEAAQHARSWAARGPDGQQGSERPEIRWHDSHSAVQAALAQLLRGRDAAAVLPLASPDDSVLLELDRAEWDAVQRARAKLERYVEDELEPQSGLRRLGALDQGLQGVEQKLRQAADAPSSLPTQGGGDHPTTEAPTGPLQLAVNLRPSPLASAAVAAALGGLAGVLAAGLVVVFSAASIGGGQTSGTVVVSGVAQSSASGWLVGVASALAAVSTALGWFVARVRGGHRRLLGAIDTAVARSGGVQRNLDRTSRRSEIVNAQLILRKKRLARSLADAVAAERARLAAIRVAVRSAHEQARRELGNLAHRDSFRVGSREHAPAVRRETALHQHLLPESALKALWLDSRKLREDDALVAHVLDAAWPKDGLHADLPFAVESVWLHGACRDQHEALLQASVFRWPGVQELVAGRLQDFLQGVPEVLGLGVRPLDDHGQPIAVGDARAVTVAASVAGRPAVQGVLQRMMTETAEAYSDAESSRVVVIRTHPGFTTRQLVNGIKSAARPRES